MSFGHKLLEKFYKPSISIKDFALKNFGGNSKVNLRILIYHDIPESEEDRLMKQLVWMKKRWKYITPKDFEDFKSGKLELRGNNLLVTFDDGFYSNRRIAEFILKPLNIKAIFFVISDFISLNREEDIEKFIRNRIFPNGSLVYQSGQRNMSWTDLAYLIHEGHVIGAHTKTHAKISSINNEAKLVEEIIKSAELIEQNLGVEVTHFAFPFGNLESINSIGLITAQQKFSFIYTGLRGNNKKDTPNWAIRRDAINVTSTFQLAGSYIEGLVDRMYSSDLKRYEKLCHDES